MGKFRVNVWSSLVNTPLCRSWKVRVSVSVFESRGPEAARTHPGVPCDAPSLGLRRGSRGRGQCPGCRVAPRCSRSCLRLRRWLGQPPTDERHRRQPRGERREVSDVGWHELLRAGLPRSVPRGREVHVDHCLRPGAPVADFRGNGVCGDPEQINGVVTHRTEGDAPLLDSPVSQQSFHPKIGGTTLYARAANRALRLLGL